MQTVAYLLPKRRHTTWNPMLEPVDITAECGVPVPLLGYVTAGQPVDIPEERKTVTVPRHMVRKNSYALRVRGHSMIDDQIQDGDIIIVEKRETATRSRLLLWFAARSPATRMASMLCHN